MRFLNTIKDSLESVYRLESEFQLQDYVVPRSEMGDINDTPEQLLVREQGDSLEMALVLDDELINHEGPFDLDRFCQCAEGISHLLYLSHVALCGKQVSQLELELQAEIDKFVLCMFALRGQSIDLITKLFLSYELRDSVTCTKAAQRYDEANRLALGFCRYLDVNFVQSEQTDALLRLLRRVYRMGGSQKREFVNEYRL
ncbi:MAG TPA: hypothetical protein EYN06_09070 [Myxococcales bacterium]|nr:hypothetical protein [Myxococcales bacterium]HIN86618.1 hypothetical protein [Myxococcales bacterium]